jgi:hypothetical protein
MFSTPRLKIPFLLLRSSVSLLNQRRNSNGLPLLLSKFYHQVEAGSEAGLVIRRLDDAMIDFSVDGVRIRRNSERFDEFFNLKRCYDLSDDYIITFNVPARYELFISKPTASSYVEELANAKSLENEKRRPSVTLAKPTVKVIVDAI